MYLPIDEAGWTAKGAVFSREGDVYRFIVPAGPFVAVAKAKDTSGKLVLSDDGAEQIDLPTMRSSVCRALYKCLTGQDAPVD